MDGSRFDRWTRALSASGSRRRLLQSGAGAILFGLLGRPEIVTSKPKKKPNKPKRKQPCPKGQRRCGRSCCTTVETCKQGRCVHHCNDGIKNQGETSTDCGGTCRNRKKCGRVQICRIDADCQSNVCKPVFADGDGVCADCRIDSQCTNLATPRCINNFCFECAADFDCANAPGRPFCIATDACPPGVPCECSECRPGQNDCSPPLQFCIAELGVCSSVECVNDTHCDSGCCNGGRCSPSLSDDSSNCGTCRNQCPGQFPQCVICCSGTCQSPPRGGPPDNECICP
jgi:hypothetical protein